MENYTFNSYVLQLEGINVTEISMYPLFFFFLFCFIFIIIANVGIVVLVIVEKNLHQPMYLLFCNLALNDILGSSIMVPRLLAGILKPPSERLISFYECVAQAFLAHMFGTTAQTVLIIMAFDRYVAICKPLRYAAIMTNKMMMKLTVSAWGVALIFVGVLLGLSLRLNRCRTLIRNPYCDNASLFKLSCESVVINNIYGIYFTVVLSIASVGSTVFIYGKITFVCLTSKNMSLNSKALKTCSTHLLVYVIMFTSGKVGIAFHRYPHYVEYKKMAILMFYIIPGTFNPIIYGAQSKEIKTFMSKFFRSTKVLSKL